MAMKEFEPDDPMELVAVPLAGGDQDQVIDGITLEYLLMGWTPLQVLSLFRSPCYGATHQIYRQRGEAYVKQRIQRLAEQWAQGWTGGGS